MISIFTSERYREFSTGSKATSPDTYDWDQLLSMSSQRKSAKFIVFKFLLDKGAAILVFPILALLTLALLVLNPFYNRGPVFFSQKRMGKDGKPFRMWKFRTMEPSDIAARDANVPLERDRITPLGKFLRKTHLDEIPNFINVFLGDMSVVGPRPDAYDHANTFSGKVTGYQERHRILPGITGLAQVEMGYAEGDEQTALKAKYDNMYVVRSCGRLDLYILKQTVMSVLLAKGK